MTAATTPLKSLPPPHRPAGGVARTVRLLARVTGDGRVSVVSPHLTPGEVVEVNLTLGEATPSRTNGTDRASGRAKDALPGPSFDVMGWLDSLPPTGRTSEEWEEWEREFQQERDSWGR